MSEIPRRALTRSARLATLPLGVAGRATLGVGKRLGGKPAEAVAAELQQRTAAQLFKVLGELKGGAMKFGQALSVLEAALPEDLTRPYRAALTKLQESAPAMPSATVHAVLARELGPGWRDRFDAFDERPSAAASIGQVHHARWADGTEVAVKIQYPGAGDALVADLNQLARLARVLSVASPGLNIRPLLDELRARVVEELDYLLEADAQRTYAHAFRGDPDILVPEVVEATPHVLVSAWVGGTPLAQVIAAGSQEQRDRAGRLLLRFLFSGVARAGLLHADPHPGNFRLLDDGRLGVLDYGAVNRLPDGLPEPIGISVRHALAGDGEAVLDALRAEGFLAADAPVDPDDLLDYLVPLLEPVSGRSFRYTRDWLRGQALRVGDQRSPTARLARSLNLPPEYLMIYRVTLGATGLLCQLEAEGEWRGEFERWVPGFADPAAGPSPAGGWTAAAAPAASAAGARRRPSSRTPPPVASW